MKQVSITQLPIGTKFIYNKMNWILTEDSYPMPCAKCLTEPNDYEGLEVCFCNFEKVEIEDNTTVYEYKFKQSGKHSYQLVRDLPF